MSGAFAFAVSIHRKKPGISPGRISIKHHSHHKIMFVKNKNSSLLPKGNLPPGKYAYLFLALVVIAPIFAAVLSGCNPVTFYLRGLGIEYQFQKGTCQLPLNQPQK